MEEAASFTESFTHSVCPGYSTHPEALGVLKAGRLNDVVNSTHRNQRDNKSKITKRKQPEEPLRLIVQEMDFNREGI